MPLTLGDVFQLQTDITDENGSAKDQKGSTQRTEYRSRATPSIQAPGRDWDGHVLT